GLVTEICPTRARCSGSPRATVLILDGAWRAPSLKPREPGCIQRVVLLSLMRSQVESAMDQLYGLECNGRRVGTQLGATPLDGTAVLEGPTTARITLMIQQHDREGLALDVARDDLPEPVPEIGVVGQAALEHNPAGVLRRS